MNVAVRFQPTASWCRIIPVASATAETIHVMIPNDFDTAFEQVIDLVNDFNKDLANCTRADYNESQVRKDYIDKFFIALGWDVNHEQQRNIYAQEVRVEPSVNVAERVKKADYSFALAPEFRKIHFFVEAKKPSVTLETPANCFQTLRYGYSSPKASLSILTNFKELIVLDCRYLPDFDTATQRIHKRYHFTDFLNSEKFAEVYYLFGREAVADGTYEKVCSELPKPKGRVKHLKVVTDGYKEIDDSFLEMLEGFRSELAKNFKKKNPALNSDDLTEAVQRTLDRLVFIRFLEDKLIEPDTILEKFGFKPNAWGQFIAKSRDFDKTYNGIIFKYHDIIDNPDFVVDDRVFLDICDTFAGDRTPYHFNYIPIHILGSIYERFLGNVIVATAKQARIEAKPEVRKAGGVFYTPQYIVKYIVENTVGALLQSSPPYEGGVAAASADGVVLSDAAPENHPTAKAAPLLRKEGSRKGVTPADVAKMRFADIACGSGSFLLGVYEYLLAWHTEYYNRTGNEKEAKAAHCIVNEDGTFHLSFEQKSDILVNNVYGVDIDRQAHEVTQLSLFLKLLEEETLATRRQLWDTERKAMLPSLANNIICGNALVDWDISSGDLFEQIDADKQKRLNPMSFESKFPKVMRNGGFDAIVGNPPYGADLDGSQINYFRRHYKSATYQIDTYPLFIERSLEKVRPEMLMGVIVPSAWVASKYNRPLRQLLVEPNRIKSIVVAPKKVFKDAVVETVLLVAQRGSSDSAYNFRVDRWDIEPQTSNSFGSGLVAESTDYVFPVYSNPEQIRVLVKIRQDSIKLASVAEAVWGVKVYQKGKGNPKQKGFESDERIFHRTVREKGSHLPLLGGSEIDRFSLTWKGNYIDYGQWLAEPRTPDWFTGTRILVREVTAKGKILAALTNEDFVFSNSIDGVRLRKDNDYSPMYLLGLLNSPVLSFYNANTSANAFKDTFPKVLIKDLLDFPIPNINLSNTDEKAKHDLIVRAVGQIMDAKAKLAAAKNDGERQHLTDKCEKYETDINTAVYSLYNLTREEINLIENG